MNQAYHEAVTQMEKMQVNREYVLGWMGGYLHNPMREEQRVTEVYEAGYADGQKGAKDNFAKWAKQ